MRRPLELRFRIGPLPVRIEPGFWGLLALLAAYGAGEHGGLEVLLNAWPLAALIALVCHDGAHLLHAWALRLRPTLVLHPFGGTLQLRPPPPRLQSIALALVGPAASFALFGVTRLLLPASPLATLVGHFSLVWGCVNLLPVLPFDGGQILLALLPKGREVQAARISGSAALGAALACGLFSSHFAEPLLPVLIFALLAYQNLQAAALLKRSQAALTPEILLASGWEALAKDDRPTASQIGRTVLHRALYPNARNGARDLLTWVALAGGFKGEASRQMEETEPPEAARPLTRAMVAEANGESVVALPFALRAFEQEPSETSAGLAIRLLLQNDQEGEAERIAHAFAWPRTLARAFASYRDDDPRLAAFLSRLGA